MSVDPIQRAILALSRLPSVGEKTAARLTFFLLNRPPELTRELSEALGALHAADYSVKRLQDHHGVATPRRAAPARDAAKAKAKA